MSDVCGDNRFEIIEAYKKRLIEDTNIESRPDEMAVIDNILLRFWQMGWLPEFQDTNVSDTIYRQAAIEAVSEACFELRGVFERCEDALKALPPAEPEWHDCDPTDKNTLPEPGSWAIWCDKEDHKIIARWKEDAIDHFWPDQRMFDFHLEDAVAWTEIPKRREG